MRMIYNNSHEFVNKAYSSLELIEIDRNLAVDHGFFMSDVELTIDRQGLRILIIR